MILSPVGSRVLIPSSKNIPINPPHHMGKIVYNNLGYKPVEMIRNSVHISY